MTSAFAVKTPIPFARKLAFVSILVVLLGVVALALLEVSARILDPLGISYYPNTAAYMDTTGTAESTYTYRVRALGPDGSPSSSPSVVVTTHPSAPAHFAVSTPDGPHVLVEWQDSSTSKTHFDIERRTTSPLSAWAPLASAGALFSSYEDATVAPETEYEYRIRVGNADGASEWSALEKITTPPHPPSDFVGESVSTNHVRLTWTDRSAMERNFRILRAVAPDGAFESLGPMRQQNTEGAGGTITERPTGITFRGGSPWRPTSTRAPSSMSSRVRRDSVPYSGSEGT